MACLPAANTPLDFVERFGKMVNVKKKLAAEVHAVGLPPLSHALQGGVASLELLVTMWEDMHQRSVLQRESV